MKKPHYHLYSSLNRTKKKNLTNNIIHFVYYFNGKYYDDVKIKKNYRKEMLLSQSHRLFQSTNTHFLIKTNIVFFFFTYSSSSDAHPSYGMCLKLYIIIILVSRYSWNKIMFILYVIAFSWLVFKNEIIWLG